MRSTSSLQAIADAAGVALATVHDYRKMGMPKGTVEESLAWIAENVPKTGRGGRYDRGKGSAAPTFRQLQEAKLKAAVQLAELEVAEKSGELLDRAAVIAAVHSHARSLRQRIEQLPLQAAKRIAADLKLPSDSLAIVRDALDIEVRRMLVQIAADPIPAALADKPEKSEDAINDVE